MGKTELGVTLVLCPFVPSSLETVSGMLQERSGVYSIPLWCVWYLKLRWRWDLVLIRHYFFIATFFLFPLFLLPILVPFLILFACVGMLVIVVIVVVVATVTIATTWCGHTVIHSC